MTAIVIEEGGFVDKFVGDEIVAIFGAPQDLPDHALRATTAALRMQERIRDLQGAFERIGCPGEIFSRTGLSTGPLVVGNMGSEMRMNYTAMGDVMNLGARLEGANKIYDTRVLATQATRDAAGAGLAFRELDRVRVKGKDKPVAIFELIGRPPLAATVEDRVRRFEQALQLYRQGRFDPAAELFCALATEGDAPSEVFAERCRDLAASPPYDWDGVYVMDTK